jgi:hypothetical protein
MSLILFIWRSIEVVSVLIVLVLLLSQALAWFLSIFPFC